MTTNPSTNNPHPGGIAGFIPLAAGEWPQGLPDPAVLARLANEFLAALPGQSPVGPDVSAPAQARLPVEAPPRTVPANLAVTKPGFAQPSIAPPASDSDGPFYYFLSELRAFGATPETPSVESAASQPEAAAASASTR